MGSFPTGITVLTVERVPGQVHGMTANSFTSVSLDPLLILVCIDQNARLLSYLKTQRRFGVSILKDTQQQLSEYFTLPQQDLAEEVAPRHSFPMDSVGNSASRGRPRAPCVQCGRTIYGRRSHHLCRRSRKPRAERRPAPPLSPRKVPHPPAFLCIGVQPAGGRLDLYTKKSPAKITGLRHHYFAELYRSELPLGRAGSAESPCSFRWLFTSRKA